MRKVAGRQGFVWHIVRSPRLRFLVHRDPVDAVLFALSVDRSRVFVVQIGSNDIGPGDPLRVFIGHKHWRGILVEPAPHAFDRLRKHYGGNPRWVLENVAITDRTGTREFYYPAGGAGLPPGYDQLSSFSMDLLREHSRMIPNLEKHIVAGPVRCLTFQDLCDRHAVETINLIQIDAEGHDLEILREIDFERYRPDVVMYEHVFLTERDRLKALDILRSHGFRWKETDHDTIALREGVGGTLGAVWKLVSVSRDNEHH